ncbi:hypothetical protein CHK_0832 [Christensenella hongkongensis]|uniref:Uncharacterized protein n=1 Tax=Christensenella hongkongensis TaxID=270498 RepID=A0A0M2NN84_9FIRM|nr:hypothetical protein CHK_0832 [Christensenella hongkongensis]
MISAQGAMKPRSRTVWYAFIVHDLCAKINAMLVKNASRM